MNYQTKDSGVRQEFATGAKRDVDADKPRYELLPVGPLTRLAHLYRRGAQKYDDDNWMKGMPFRRTFGSLLRHAFQWAAGDRSEDHLAGVVFNAFCLMHYEDELEANRLPSDLDNMPYREGRAHAADAAAPHAEMSAADAGWPLDGSGVGGIDHRHAIAKHRAAAAPRDILPFPGQHGPGGDGGRRESVEWPHGADDLVLARSVDRPRDGSLADAVMMAVVFMTIGGWVGIALTHMIR